MAHAKIGLNELRSECLRRIECRGWK